VLGLLGRRVDFLRRVAYVEEQLQTIGGEVLIVDLKRRRVKSSKTSS
jgi:hypothetical protein